jgi:hypothetical protein
VSFQASRPNIENLSRFFQKIDFSAATPILSAALPVFGLQALLPFFTAYRNLTTG